jgi:hypothetical protein
MEKEVVVALIGAAATVATTLIGAAASIKAKRAPQRRPGTPTQFWLEGAFIAFSLVAAASIIAFGLRSANASIDLRQATALAPTGRSLLTPYQDLVIAGLKKQKSYVIPSVTMIVKLDRMTDGTQRLQSTTHIIYSIHALSGIGSGTPGFNEFYHSSSSEDVYYLPGADKERLTESAAKGMKAWDVFFDLPAGGRRTIVTTSSAVYPPGLASGRKVHFFQNVGANEDAFCYPNTDGDVIGEMLFMVESDTLDLHLVPGDTQAAIQRDNSIIDADASVFQEQQGSPKRRVVVARFGQVQARDVAGVKVAW